jgi:hypothetical protein
MRQGIGTDNLKKNADRQRQSAHSSIIFYYLRPVAGVPSAANLSDQRQKINSSFIIINY